MTIYGVFRENSDKPSIVSEETAKSLTDTAGVLVKEFETMEKFNMWAPCDYEVPFFYAYFVRGRRRILSDIMFLSYIYADQAFCDRLKQYFEDTGHNVQISCSDDYLVRFNTYEEAKAYLATKKKDYNFSTTQHKRVTVVQYDYS